MQEIKEDVSEIKEEEIIVNKITDLNPQNSLAFSQDNNPQTTEQQYNKEKYEVTKQLVDEWRKDMVAKQTYSYDTIATYYSFLKKFTGFSAFLTQKKIESFRQRNNNTGSTAAIKSFINFLVDEKDFPESLYSLHFRKHREKKKPENINPEEQTEMSSDDAPLTSDEVKLIIDNILSEKPEEIDQRIWDMAKEKYTLMTTVIYELALRIEESLRLNWGDFNWAEWVKDRTKYGHVTLKRTKGGKSRTLPVKPETMLWLYDLHIKRAPDKMSSDLIPIPNKGLVFRVLDEELSTFIAADNPETPYVGKETQINEQKFKHYLNISKRAYREILYKASLAGIKRRVSPHQLRKARAQNLLDGDMPIEVLAKYLGHANISTTTIYAQANIKKVEEEIIRIEGDKK